MQLEAPRNEMEIAFARQRALMEKQEELTPELDNHLYENAKGHLFIHHPLVVSINCSEGRFAYVNDLFWQRVQIVEDALKERDWFNYFISHEKPYRLQALDEIAHRMPDQDYWEQLGSILCDSENLFEQQDTVRRLVTSDRPEQQFIMDENERSEIEELSSELTVYRGYSVKSRSRAWSWTLDQDKAEWFAGRCRLKGIKSGPPRIAQGKVRKDDIIAYFSRREESEIVVDPKLVSEIKDARVN